MPEITRDPEALVILVISIPETSGQGIETRFIRCPGIGLQPVEGSCLLHLSACNIIAKVRYQGVPLVYIGNMPTLGTKLSRTDGIKIIQGSVMIQPEKCLIISIPAVSGSHQVRPCSVGFDKWDLSAVFQMRSPEVFCHPYLGADNHSVINIPVNICQTGLLRILFTSRHY